MSTSQRQKKKGRIDSSCVHFKLMDDQLMVWFGYTCLTRCSFGLFHPTGEREMQTNEGLFATTLGPLYFHLEDHLD